MAGLIETMTVDADRLRLAAPQGFSLATDLAEALVRNGLPFRDAHEIVGSVVGWCAQAGRTLESLTDAELASISPHLTPDTRAVLSVDGALAARSAYGGTAPPRVTEQLDALRRQVEQHAAWAAC
jgi:argininosuccinate lyase